MTRAAVLIGVNRTGGLPTLAAAVTGVRMGEDDGALGARAGDAARAGEGRHRRDGGRFAVTVNFVEHRTESTARGIAGRALAGHWPVLWAVRRALDECGDFAAAKAYLSGVPLLAPVMLTLSGVKEREAVVLERSATHVGARDTKDGAPVYVTNHYTSAELAPYDAGNDPMNSGARFEALRAKLSPRMADPAEALKVLSTGELLSDDTQHQVVMCAAEGWLEVRIPDGDSAEIRL